MKNLRKISVLAMLIAIEIVLTRFLSIQTTIIRIGFGFLPIAIAGMFFGPVYAGIAGAMSDILGMIIFPKSAYFPGFTFTAMIRGVIFGLCFYKSKVNLRRIVISAISTVLICDLTLNTIWLRILTKDAFSYLLIPRLIKAGFMIPIVTLLIHGFWTVTGKTLIRQIQTS